MTVRNYPSNHPEQPSNRIATQNTSPTSQQPSKCPGLHPYVFFLLCFLRFFLWDYLGERGGNGIKRSVLMDKAINLSPLQLLDLSLKHTINGAGRWRGVRPGARQFAEQQRGSRIWWRGKARTWSSTRGQWWTNRRRTTHSVQPLPLQVH